MSFASQVKYSRLTDLEANDGKSSLEINDMRATGDQSFSFDTIYTYEEDRKSKKYDHKKDEFNSMFKYNHMTAGRPRGHLAVDVRDDVEMNKPSQVLVATSYILTFMSYCFFAITLPLTYWFFVKKLGEFDRLVVFRLGKMIGVKGPGRVIIFPWMDRTKK